MKYEIYIQERKKSQKFCKKAIAEYEKRLSRYCKISCKFVKKEKSACIFFADMVKLKTVM